MTELCIAQTTAGEGGIGGGGGYQGQTSQLASGHGSRSYGVPIIKTTTGMYAQFTVQLTKDLQGVYPIDLADIQRVQLICKTSGHTNALFKVPCQIQQNGKVYFQLTPKEVNYKPGIHFAQFHCYDYQNKLRHVFKCCIQIQKSLKGSHRDCFQPLTIAQVRMALYDTSGQQNQLLDDLQFSDVVIARCMKRAVADWNQMPPQLSTGQTAATFPYTANLCNGTVGYVLQMAAHRYVRNQMRHSNAGLSMDDHQKGTLYLQLANSLIQEWKAWVQTKKNQLNILQCMGTISDAYLQDRTDIWW